MTVYVVHVRQKYDVYIGRGRCPKTGKRGEFGNPFIIGRDGSRAEVIEKYRDHVDRSPGLRQRIRQELRGRVLGCWCAPEACHGDVLAKVANA